MADLGERSRSSQGGTGPARVLAPLALVASVVVIALIVASSLGGEENGGERSGGQQQSDQPARNGEDEGGEDGGESTPREYVVESGDSLSGIAERFDISVKRIERLNPDVDPQALGEGQVLQLRQGGGSD